MSVLELISIEKIAVAKGKTKCNFIVGEQKIALPRVQFSIKIIYATLIGVPPETDTS